MAAASRTAGIRISLEHPTPRIRPMRQINSDTGFCLAKSRVPLTKNSQTGSLRPMKYHTIATLSRIDLNLGMIETPRTQPILEHPTIPKMKKRRSSDVPDHLPLNGKIPESPDAKYEKELENIYNEIGGCQPPKDVFMNLYMAKQKPPSHEYDPVLQPFDI